MKKILNQLTEKISNIPLPALGSKEVVAFDLGSSNIKIVQLKPQLKGWSLVRAALIPLDIEKTVDISPLEVRELVRGTLHRYFQKEKIKVKNAVTAVSGNSVIVRFVKFPKMKPEDLARTIQFEAEPYIPFDPREVNIGFYILGEVTEDEERKLEVVLVAAKKELIELKMAILEGIGFHPIVIDVDAFALENAYGINRDPNLAETVLFVNIGASVTNINIVENGVSRVVRDISIAGNSFTSALQKTLRLDLRAAEELKLRSRLVVESTEKEQLLAEGKKEDIQISNVLLPLAKDLTAEVQRSLDFYLSQGVESQVNRILLSGGGSRLANLDHYLSKELHLPAEFFNPFSRIQITDQSLINPELAPLFAVAVGLAIRRGQEKKK